MKTQEKEMFDQMEEVLKQGLKTQNDKLYLNHNKKRYKYISCLPKKFVCFKHVFTFNRRYYLDKAIGKYVFLLDN
ncbi:UPF0236 family protein [bacterium]|nr:UPF0236 family protein [bacterium]